MTAVIVSFDGVRVNDAEDSATWATLGAGGAGPQDESDFFLQGTQGVSRKIGTTLGGQSFDYSGTGSVDMTATDRKIWMAKIQATNKDILLSNGSPAMELRLGSSVSAYYQYDVYGNDDYPLLGGWVVFPLDPNEAGYRSGGGTAPTLTAVDWFGFQCDFSGTSKGENVVIDAVDVGIGLCLTNGDSTDTDGEFSDFLDEDQGQVTTGRWGFWTEINEILNVFGRHWIGRNTSGTAVATEFTDSQKTLLFPDGLFGAGGSGLSFDLGNASTIIDLEKITLTGLGAKTRRYFDTRTEANGGYIDDTNDEIRFPEPHNFKNGDYILYSKGNGTAAIGLTDATNYWVGRVSDVAITLHTGNRRDALAGTNTVNLTGTATGTADQHQIEKVVNTGPELLFSGTSGIANIDLSIFSNIAKLTLTSVVDFASCVFNDIREIVQGSGRLDSNTFNFSKLFPGESLMVVDDALDIDDNVFDSRGGWGHALEFDTAGDYTLVGNVFHIDYHREDGDTWNFSVNLVDSTQDLINMQFSAGAIAVATGTPVYYDKLGGTENIGLTEGTLYWFGRAFANRLTLHLSRYDAIAGQNRINLTQGVSETHTFYLGNASIYNSSGGTVNLTMQQNGGIGTLSPHIRNDAGSTTVVSASVPITIHLQSAAGLPIIGATVRIEDATTGALITDGWTVPSAGPKGTFTNGSLAYTGDVDVNIKIRANSNRIVTNFDTPGIRYQAVNIPATITSDGLTLTLSMAVDSNAKIEDDVVPSSRILRSGVQRMQWSSGSNSAKFDIYIPNKGTNRKLVFSAVCWYDSALKTWTNAATVDGASATLIHTHNLTFETTEFVAQSLCYYDIPDGKTGWFEVLNSYSGGLISDFAGAWIILDDMASGAPEDDDTGSQDNATGDPSVTLNNTTADAISLHFYSENKITSEPVPAAGEDLIRSDTYPGGAVDVSNPTHYRIRNSMVAEQRTTTGSHTVSSTITGTKSYIESGATFAKN